MSSLRELGAPVCIVDVGREGAEPKREGAEG
jgi:hypothetical protein